MSQRRPDGYDLCAGTIIACGTLLRLVFILQGWPASYNDEGTLGLMALHIAYRGAHPLLYYGQDYLGSLEAYLGAGFFHLFGPSTPALRLGLLLLFALFLVSMYVLVSLLYAKSLALVTLVFLSLGSPEVLLRQLMAAGGTPELMLFTTLLLLLTAWLALTTSPSPRKFYREGNSGDTPPAQQDRARPSWRRSAVYAAWGLIAGLDLYSHLLCLPFVLSAGLMLVLFCRRELRLLSISLLLLCLLIGLSPLIIYNVTTPVTPHELSLFTGAFGGGYREPSYPAPQGGPAGQAFVAPRPIGPRPVQQIAGTVLVGIPVATSGAGLCPVTPEDAWPLTGQSSDYTLFCTGVHGLWGAGFVLLWLIASTSALKHLMAYRRFRRERVWSPELHRASIIQAARLMILLGAGITILAFTLYPQAAAVTPWISARYLVGLLIAVPAVLFPLWDKRGQAVKMLRAFTEARIPGRPKGAFEGRGLPNAEPGACHSERSEESHSPQRFFAALRMTRSGTGGCNKPIRVRTFALARYALITATLAAALLGTSEIFTTQVPLAQASSASQQALINRLVSMGATRIYTDYDDCNRIAFLSNERIVCAVLDTGLQPGLDRYFPYREEVASAAHPFYLFPAGSVQAFLLEQKATEQHIGYRKFVVGGYVIYDPAYRIAT